MVSLWPPLHGNAGGKICALLLRFASSRVCFSRQWFPVCFLCGLILGFPDYGDHVRSRRFLQPSAYVLQPDTHPPWPRLGFQMTYLNRPKKISVESYPNHVESASNRVEFAAEPRLNRSQTHAGRTQRAVSRPALANCQLPMLVACFQRPFTRSHPGALPEYSAFRSANQLRIRTRP